MNKGLYLYQGGQCVSCNVGIVSSTAVSVDEHGKRTVNEEEREVRETERVEYRRERKRTVELLKFKSCVSMCLPLDER